MNDRPGPNTDLGLYSPALRERAMSLFFPPACVACGKTVAAHVLWCGCPLVFWQTALCPRCGGVAGRCGCPAPLIPALSYEAAGKGMVLRLKETPDRRTGRFLAQAMNRALASSLPGRRFDLVAAIPISPEKRLSRGFNQAALLAGQLARLRKIPLQGRLLAHRERPHSQHSLQAGQRWENARQAFYLLDSSPITGKHVLLVDDVTTTGATALYCAGLLSGAASVTVATAAAAIKQLQSYK